MLFRKSCYRSYKAQAPIESIPSITWTLDVLFQNRFTRFFLISQSNTKVQPPLTDTGHCGVLVRLIITCLCASIVLYCMSVCREESNTIPTAISMLSRYNYSMGLWRMYDLIGNKKSKMAISKPALWLPQIEDNVRSKFLQLYQYFLMTTIQWN